MLPAALRSASRRDETRRIRTLPDTHGQCTITMRAIVAVVAVPDRGSNHVAPGTRVSIASPCMYSINLSAGREENELHHQRHARPLGYVPFLWPNAVTSLPLSLSPRMPRISLEPASACANSIAAWRPLRPPPTPPFFLFPSSSAQSAAYARHRLAQDASALPAAIDRYEPRQSRARPSLDRGEGWPSHVLEKTTRRKQWTGLLSPSDRLLYCFLYRLIPAPSTGLTRRVVRSFSIPRFGVVGKEIRAP